MIEYIKMRVMFIRYHFSTFERGLFLMLRHSLKQELNNVVRFSFGGRNQGKTFTMLCFAKFYKLPILVSTSRERERMIILSNDLLHFEPIIYTVEDIKDISRITTFSKSFAVHLQTLDEAEYKTLKELNSTISSCVVGISDN